MITGLRPNTFTNLQLNAGFFVKDFDYSSYTTGEALAAAILGVLSSETGILGATVGGGSFECKPTSRQIDADGMRYPVKGSTVFDKFDVKLKTTLKEITPGNFLNAIPTADAAVSGRKTTITVRTDLDDADYIDHLIWVGDTSSGYVLIDLENALNISGAVMNFNDKGEGSLPVEFVAHSGSLAAMDYAPVTIIFLTNLTTAEYLEVNSVEGANSGTTRLAVTPQKAGTESYLTKTAAAVDLPETGDILVGGSGGWVAWDGDADVTATTGHQIVVAVVTTATGAVVAAGRDTVVAKA